MATQAEYVSTGNTVSHTPGVGETVANGDVLPFGNGIKVVQGPSTEGRPVGCAIEGIFRFDKQIGAGTDYAVGEAVGWDSSNNRARKFTAGVDNYAGIAVQAAAVTDTYIDVKINAPQFPAIPS